MTHKRREAFDRAKWIQAQLFAEIALEHLPMAKALEEIDITLRQYYPLASFELRREKTK